MNNPTASTPSASTVSDAVTLKRSRLRARYVLVAACGLFQVIAGLALVSLGVLSFAYRSWSSGIGQGLWGGFWIASTGLVGSCGGCYRSRGMSVAFLILSSVPNIITAAAVLLISGAGYFVDHYSNVGEYGYYSPGYSWMKPVLEIWPLKNANGYYEQQLMLQEQATLNQRLLYQHDEPCAYQAASINLQPSFTTNTGQLQLRSNIRRQRSLTLQQNHSNVTRTIRFQYRSTAIAKPMYSTQAQPQNPTPTPTYPLQTQLQQRNNPTYTTIQVQQTLPCIHVMSGNSRYPPPAEIPNVHMGSVPIVPKEPAAMINFAMASTAFLSMLVSIFSAFAVCSATLGCCLCFCSSDNCFEFGLQQLKPKARTCSVAPELARICSEAQPHRNRNRNSAQNHQPQSQAQLPNYLEAHHLRMHPPRPPAYSDNNSEQQPQLQSQQQQEQQIQPQQQIHFDDEMPMSPPPRYEEVV